MKLILVRHGRPERQRYFFSSLSQHEERLNQYDEAVLSELGAEAVSKLAGELPEAKILSSDLPRARITAEILGMFSEDPIYFDPLYREIKTTFLTGGPWGKLWGPNLFWTLLRTFSWFLGIGDYSESPRQVWQRAGLAARSILKQFETEETVILVSHGWFLTILVFYLRIHGLVKEGPLRPDVGYGAATEYILKSESK